MTFAHAVADIVGMVDRLAADHFRWWKGPRDQAYTGFTLHATGISPGVFSVSLHAVCTGPSPEALAIVERLTRERHERERAEGVR